jgi:MinD superfamily P-loop ATPase
MKIAILSGKGGTGKTLLSVNLAEVASPSVYIDCDVEEPNGHLFFKPDWQKTEEIQRQIPVIDGSKCDLCQKCVEFCRFNALAAVADKIMVFDKICHSCGGCQIVCPQNAITETNKTIGEVRQGQAKGVKVLSGIMKVGESSGVPIIEALLREGRELEKKSGQELVSIIDCPPGSACTVMESIKDADYCVLVAEPTIFGVHNLNMVRELVKVFNKPHGVVINKAIKGESIAEAYCSEKSLKLLYNIPFNKEMGRLNSDGQIVSRISAEYRGIFEELYEIIKGELGR